MVNNNYIQLLKNPEEIQDTHTLDLKSITEAYPYFQSARALYLKALKNQESFKYNNQLKVTAAHTTDRTVLFNFITSQEFNDTLKQRIASPKQTINEVYSNANSIEEAKEVLTIGKPINFSQSETHSFNQWLQLGSNKPINRKKNPVKIEKESIIDNFIATSPKISRVSKTTATSNKTSEIVVQQSQLMTETLAKVYLEQKKFDNAIKAYEILSLKYPEKSGFFADQINRIQIIQKNK